MIRNTFDRFLAAAFHAAAICTVVIAAAAGASLLQPDHPAAADPVAGKGVAPAAGAMARQDRAPAARI